MKGMGSMMLTVMGASMFVAQRDGTGHPLGLDDLADDFRPLLPPPAKPRKGWKPHPANPDKKAARKRQRKARQITRSKS